MLKDYTMCVTVHIYWKFISDDSDFIQLLVRAGIEPGALLMLENHWAIFYALPMFIQIISLLITGTNKFSNAVSNKSQQ